MEDYALHNYFIPLRNLAAIRKKCHVKLSIFRRTNSRIYPNRPVWSEIKNHILAGAFPELHPHLELFIVVRRCIENSEIILHF